jgi:hypothetical protein
MKRLTLRQEISIKEAPKGGDIAHQNMTEPNIHIIRKSTEGSSGSFRAALLRLKGAENIAKNMTTPGLLAYIATAKYADVLPLYRQVLHVGVSGRTGRKPVVLFRYSPTRAGEIAAEMLSGYEGYVQSDGFSGYNIPEAKGSPDRLFVGMAHVRRKFFKVIYARGRAGPAKTGSAEAALSYIGRLCEVESHLVWSRINTCAF